MSDNKITAALAAEMAAPDAPAEQRIIVKYKRDLSTATRPLAGVARPKHFSLVPAAAMRASAEQIRALASDPGVETIWPDLKVHTCLDVSAPHIQAPQVWAAGYTGRDVRVAIVDTGIDPPIRTLPDASSPWQTLPERERVITMAMEPTWPGSPRVLATRTRALPLRHTSMPPRCCMVTARAT